MKMAKATERDIDAAGLTDAAIEQLMEWPSATMNLYHVDDCMYVLAADAEAARAHVRQECGDGCGEVVKEASLDMQVTTADVDEGEEVTPDTMTTARALAEEHLRYGGALPYTLLYDAGM